MICSVHIVFRTRLYNLKKMRLAVKSIYFENSNTCKNKLCAIQASSVNHLVQALVSTSTQRRRPPEGKTYLSPTHFRPAFIVTRETREGPRVRIEDIFRSEGGCGRILQCVWCQNFFFNTSKGGY